MLKCAVKNLHFVIIHSSSCCSKPICLFFLSICPYNKSQYNLMITGPQRAAKYLKESQTSLESHKGEQIITELSFLGKLSL